MIHSDGPLGVSWRRCSHLFPLVREKITVQIAFRVFTWLCRVIDWRPFLYQIVEFSVKNVIEWNKTQKLARHSASRVSLLFPIKSKFFASILLPRLDMSCFRCFHPLTFITSRVSHPYSSIHASAASAASAVVAALVAWWRLGFRSTVPRVLLFLQFCNFYHSACTLQSRFLTYLLLSFLYTARDL